MTVKDLSIFLESIESSNNIDNERKRLNWNDCKSIKQLFPCVPEEYLEYLSLIGHGVLRDCAVCIYPKPAFPNIIMGDGVFSNGKFDNGIFLAFGDDFSGDLLTFNSEDGSVVRLSHVDGSVHISSNSFIDTVCELAGIGLDGTDLFE
jgi:hypothetical protein